MAPKGASVKKRTQRCLCGSLSTHRAACCHPSPCQSQAPNSAGSSCMSTPVRDTHCATQHTHAQFLRGAWCGCMHAKLVEFSLRRTKNSLVNEEAVAAHLAAGGRARRTAQTMRESFAHLSVQVYRQQHLVALRRASFAVTHAGCSGLEHTLHGSVKLSFLRARMPAPSSSFGHVQFWPPEDAPRRCGCATQRRQAQERAHTLGTEGSVQSAQGSCHCKQQTVPRAAGAIHGHGGWGRGGGGGGCR